MDFTSPYLLSILDPQEYKDNLEAGSSAKVVDCILELKALHDWKEMNGGNGFNKPLRSPFVMLTAGKINSQVLEETSLDPHRRLSMTSSCYKETPVESETQNLEELIVATIDQCMGDKKENIEANLLASICSRNPAAIKFLCKNMISCLKEQGQKMQPEEKFERLCEEQVKVGLPVDKNALFLEAAGGFDKKKRVYGLGSSQDLFYRPQTIPYSSSFANMENHKLREELKVVKDKMKTMENQIAKILEINSFRHAQSPTTDVDDVGHNGGDGDE